MFRVNSRKLKSVTPVERPARPASPACELFERLEERIAFYVGPMITSPPPLTDLTDPNNTVVRMRTSAGTNIDIELFDQDAPVTVANFLRYINEGRLDETFFHQLIPNTALYGGAFTFHDNMGVGDVQTFPPIANEFGLLNLQRTLAMNRPIAQPNAATSQFFINLVDNEGFDTQGFAVFGRILPGSWSVVQSIAGLDVRDLNQQLTGGSTGPFAAVPTHANFDPAVGPTEASLVRITDIEVIKAENSEQFFTHAAYMSEGFHSPTVTERIDLHNLERERVNFYQVIVRYERGMRDQVIASGLLQGGQRASFQIADAQNPELTVVRSDEPYAIEVRSTQALGATLNRSDFDGIIHESFLNVTSLDAAHLQVWNLPAAERSDDIPSFLTYQNLTEDTLTITITVFNLADGSSTEIPIELEAFRRGGLELHNMDVIPAGPFALRIEADGPIIVGLTEYNTAPTPAQASASMTHGAFAGGSTQGDLAGAFIPVGGQGFVDLFYSAETPAQLNVELSYVDSSGHSPPITALLFANQRSTRVNLIERFGGELPVGEHFTLRYRVVFGLAPVSAQFVAIGNGAEVVTNFQTATTGALTFADGFTDPALVGNGMNEVISVFNPYAESQLFQYQMFFSFADGTVVASPFFTLQPRGRMDHRAWDIVAVRDKIESGEQFHQYSISLVAAVFADPLGQHAVIAQLNRTHATQGLSTLPSLHPVWSQPSNPPLSWMWQPEFAWPA